jgi:hypothetical protein
MLASLLSGLQKINIVVGNYFLGYKKMVPYAGKVFFICVDVICILWLDDFSEWGSSAMLRKNALGIGKWDSLFFESRDICEVIQVYLCQ